MKDYTGEEKTAWSLTFFGQRMEIFGTPSISWPFYDKITTVRQLSLPGGGALPLSLGRETFRAYAPRAVQVDLEAAQDLLEASLLERLRQLVGEDGVVESTQFSAQVADGLLKVTLTAQCREEIGREQPGTEKP